MRTPDRPTERKAREHGETWKHARRLYLAHPFIPAADLAHVLGVSLARFNVCIEGLRDDRKRRCQDALQRLKLKERL